MKIKTVARQLQLLLVALSVALALLPVVEAQQGGRLLTAQEVKQPPAKAKRFALVIGVDEYQDAQISRLSGALPVSSDAERQKSIDSQTDTENAGGAAIEMVRVPSGKFTMGSPDSEAGRDKDEGPQHSVSISSFFMGKYEVTQAQWRAVASLPKVTMDLHPDPSNFKGSNLPIEQVSWDEAIEFCARLSRVTGKSYRLPTEAEWDMRRER